MLNNIANLILSITTLTNLVILMSIISFSASVWLGLLRTPIDTESNILSYNYIYHLFY